MVGSNSVNWDLALGIVSVGALLRIMGIMGRHGVAVAIEVVREEVVLGVLDVQVGHCAAVLTRNVVVVSKAVLIVPAMWASMVDWGIMAQVVLPVIIVVRVVVRASVGVVVDITVVSSLSKVVCVESIGCHSHVVESA
jgi:hypothetical protein